MHYFTLNNGTVNAVILCLVMQFFWNKASIYRNTDEVARKSVLNFTRWARHFKNLPVTIMRKWDVLPILGLNIMLKVCLVMYSGNIRKSHIE